MLRTLFIALLFPIIILSQKEITNQTIWYSGEFYPEMLDEVKSMNSGDYFTVLNYDYALGYSYLDSYSYEDYSKHKTIFSAEDFDIKTFSDYQFNNDESKLLIATSSEAIYRHSTKSNYYIYDIKTKKLSALTDFSLDKQQLAKFSPTQNKVAFVRNNNIFIKDLDSDKEIAVTTDGKINNLINGATDWVYEEEFSFDKGFYWSPDGSKLAYYTFFEGDVKEFQMELYGKLYPNHYKFKYPKAGESNSIINIKVYEVNYDRTTTFDIGTNDDIYIPRIKWTNNSDVLSVQRMNRLQNKLEILTGKFTSDRPNNIGVSTEVIYTEESDTYIDIHDNLTFIENERSFLWTSEKDGYNHIYLIDSKNNTETQITKGSWEVTQVYGYDEKARIIYFQAAKKNSTQREVYKIKIGDKEPTLISTKSGTNEAEFSKSFNYYIHTNSTANSPHLITLHNREDKLLKTLIDNNELINRLEKYKLSKKEFFTIKNENGDELNYWRILPPNFDKTKKHPLLMFVYGGPGINTVNDGWEWNNYFWWQSLAQQGYVVISVDARGTGYRGKDFKHCTYLQLGKLETEDQIFAAREFGKLDYIDKDRIGIFGWSYGGYLSSLCITKGADVFSSAIAVAPVTNWRFYDNIYTERFMRTPKENGENYDINSPINHVEKLEGNYLLIHGSADDNVHFQNSMEMINALVNSNKQFDFFVYPDKNHGIHGGYTRWNLYDKMTKFLLDNL
jgi:dipeptidyl-peptidase 4